MAISVTTTYQTQTPAEVFAGRAITENPFYKLLWNQHYLYSTCGARCPILVRDVPFTTTSATQTQVDSSADTINLDRYQNVLRCIRPLSIGSDTYRVCVRASLENLILEVDIFDVLTNSSLGTVTLANTTTTVIVREGCLDFTVAEAEITGEPRVLLVSIVGATFSTKDAGTTGYLYGVTALEMIATATEMP